MGSKSKAALFIDSFVRSLKAQPGSWCVFCWGELYVARVWYFGRAFSPTRQASIPSGEYISALSGDSVPWSGIRVIMSGKG